MKPSVAVLNFFPKFYFTTTQNTTQPNSNASHDTSKTMDDNDYLRPVWPGRDGAITQGYSVPTPGRAVGYLPGQGELYIGYLPGAPDGPPAPARVALFH